MSITLRVALRAVCACVPAMLAAGTVTGCGTTSKGDAAQATKVENVHVNAEPTGPPTPSGGWSVAYADGFNATLGSAQGQDNTWQREEGENGFTNSNEIQVFRAAKAQAGPEGLELACTYRGGSGRKYECGAVNSGSAAAHPFYWKTGGPETWAFECYCKWPVNTGEADPGWWTDDHKGNDEFDFFEGDGWSNEGSEYDAFMPAIVQLKVEHKVDGFLKTLGFYPEAGLHRYTTALTPDGGSTYTASEYVDGTPRWSFSYTDSKHAWDDLKLSYALREYAGGFTSGTRDFDIRSVTVYEDKAHEGKDIEGGGVASGTVVGSSLSGTASR